MYGLLGFFIFSYFNTRLAGLPRTPRSCFCIPRYVVVSLNLSAVCSCIAIAVISIVLITTIRLSFFTDMKDHLFFSSSTTTFPENFGQSLHHTRTSLFCISLQKDFLYRNLLSLGHLINIFYFPPFAADSCCLAYSIHSSRSIFPHFCRRLAALR